MIKKYRNSREKRQVRIKAVIKGTAKRPRLSVFRSNKYIYTQLIDDTCGKTLISKKTERKEKVDKKNNPSEPKNKINQAETVGKILASEALKKGIKTIVFDRSGYRYHGRVKALADGLRSEKLEF